MDEIASQIAKMVVEDTKYFSAIIGFLGVIIGASITVIGNIVVYRLKEKAEAKKYEPHKKLLLKMLEDARFPDRWRNLATLMHVIGADEETAKRLLLEVGARASEDGQAKWGLIKHHPFKEKQ